MMPQVAIKCIEKKYDLNRIALEAMLARVTSETDMVNKHFLFCDFVEFYQYLMKSLECEEQNCIHEVFAASDNVLHKHYQLGLSTFCNRPDSLKGTTVSARAWEAIMYRYNQVLEALKVQEANQLEDISTSFNKIRRTLYDLSVA
jgi:hypothetical protein